MQSFKHSVVGVFSLLLIMGLSAQAAYADGVYDLTLWNNNASDGTIRVTVTGNGTANGRVVVVFVGADSRATIDKFFWNGSASLVFDKANSSPGPNNPANASWTQTADHPNGFNADGLGNWQHLITDTSNGNPAWNHIEFTFNGTIIENCFAAHVNRPNSHTDAFVTNQTCAPAPEPVSFVLLGSGLLALVLVRKRLQG